MTAALNDAILLLARCIASASGSAAQQVGPFGLSDSRRLGISRHHVMARVTVLVVLMMQALAEQSCQEESQEESSTLMQLNHRDLDQRSLKTSSDSGGFPAWLYLGDLRRSEEI